MLAPLHPSQMRRAFTSSLKKGFVQRIQHRQPTCRTMRGGLWSMSSTGSRFAPPSHAQAFGSLNPCDAEADAMTGARGTRTAFGAFDWFGDRQTRSHSTQRFPLTYRSATCPCLHGSPVKNRISPCRLASSKLTSVVISPRPRSLSSGASPKTPHGPTDAGSR